MLTKQTEDLKEFSYFRGGPG